MTAIDALIERLRGMTGPDVGVGYAAFIAASEWQDWDEDEIKLLVRAALLAALQAKSQPPERISGQEGGK